jgi:hypothetical protein
MGAGDLLGKDARAAGGVQLGNAMTPEKRAGRGVSHKLGLMRRKGKS